MAQDENAPFTAQLHMPPAPRWPRRLRGIGTAIALVLGGLAGAGPASARDGMGGAGAAMAAAAGELVGLCALWTAMVVVGIVAALLRWRGGGVVWKVINGITLAVHALATAFFIFIGVKLDAEFFFLLAPLVLVIPQVVFTLMPPRRSAKRNKG